MWKGLKKTIPVIGIIIVAYIIIKSGPDKIMQAFYSVQIVYIIPVFFLITAYIILQSYKWKYILDSQGIRLGFGYLVKIYLISVFYSTFTPGRLGTFIRIGYIKNKTGKSLGECSSSVVLDKLIDIISLFTIAIIGIGLVMGYLLDMFLITIMVAFFLLFIVGVCLFMKRNLSIKVMRIVYRFIVPKKMKMGAKDMFEGFYGNILQKKSLVAPFIVTIISWEGVYIANYMIAISMGISIPWHIFITAFSVATIIGLIPITVGGWGTREAALIGLFSPFGVEASSIIAMSILAFLFNGLIPAVVGAGISLMEE